MYRSPYVGMGSLLTNSIWGKFSPVDKADAARRRAVMEAHEREMVRQSKIRLNVCPSCDGKLTRGKKDKRNSHKRAWVCTVCKTTHYI